MDPYPRFVVVSGLIGVGKTSLAAELGKLLGYETLFEPVEENPYLADFYKDPARFKGVVLDRSIHEESGAIRVT